MMQGAIAGSRDSSRPFRIRPLIAVLAAIGAASAAAEPPGRAAFRFDTLGSEQLWTDVLRMHEVIPDLVDPNTALGVGLKVDVRALPAELLDALANEEVPLDDPAVTVELLRLNAVVGVQGRVNDAGVLESVGVTCALCHSTVDDSFAPGIGRRLDGWANVDLDPGRILALSPALGDDVKAQLLGWGPGKYDPRHHTFDGVDLEIINEQSLPVVIPPIYGLRGVEWETFTGDGPISYWNSYVGVSQMGGQGDFSDDRIGLEIDQEPDLVTPRLGELLRYQLGLKTPKPPKGSFEPRAAARGRRVFRAACASCHVPPLYTDVTRGEDPDQPLLHDPDEVGTEGEYATRSATGQYRTTPLRGLWQHPPYFHDGSAQSLEEVVDRDGHGELPLDAEQKAALVEFLKSL